MRNNGHPGVHQKKKNKKKQTWRVGVVHKQKLPQPYSVDTKRHQCQSGRY